MRISPGALTLLLLYITKVPAIFIDADIRIEGIKIGDHKIKKKFFNDDNTIFLKRY